MTIALDATGNRKGVRQWAAETARSEPGQRLRITTPDNNKIEGVTDEH
jgi:hypothetical protein